MFYDALIINLRLRIANIEVKLIVTFINNHSHLIELVYKDINTLTGGSGCDNIKLILQQEANFKYTMYKAITNLVKQ